MPQSGEDRVLRITVSPEEGNATVCHGTGQHNPTGGYGYTLPLAAPHGDLLLRILLEAQARGNRVRLDYTQGQTQAQRIITAISVLPPGQKDA